ncbi:capsid assembly scaffolding protein Gp46 family protein [Prescottella equi]|uniref:capsid assembly scaffolding protein Gp46 family protein n=1 Tax=Rhodococcus hoagii TaxID=43767 RepID=UPI0007CD6AB5|nr:DUF4355 domain-containing protein [Prescottella equi]
MPKTQENGESQENGGGAGGNGPEGGGGQENGGGGDSFTPITSQADLDRIIGQRLTRERAQYANHDQYKASHEELTKLRDGEKSELQREKERADAAEKRSKELEDDKLRRDVAADKGLPAKLAARLRGSTKEELEADADELLADYAPPADSGRRQLPGKPRENLRGGGSPDDEPEETDPAKLAALVPRD